MMPLSSRSLRILATSFSFIVVGFISLAVSIFAPTLQAQQPARVDEILQGQGRGPDRFGVGQGQQQLTYDSPTLKASIPFNAIAPHWKEQLGPHGTREVYVRVSSDGSRWSRWMNIDASGPLRDHDPHPDTTFAEVPLMIEGQYFQYRVKLGRPSVSDPSPTMSDLTMTYLDSRQSALSNMVSQARSWFTRPVLAADQGPQIVTRSQWGSSDPDGRLFTGAAYWQPDHHPVTQIFLHHTVNVNDPSDPAAVVRAIWSYHAYTRGWGDIGYNYLVDQHGTVYEGRFGGENVDGGHVYGFNSGSMGVAMIGCFQSDDATCQQLNGGNVTGPSAAMLDGLTTLLSWKTTNYEINPNTTHTFCGSTCLSLWTIAAHKDVGGTACPGNLLYDQLSTIRSAVVTKNGSQLWPYSAKQLSYNSVALNGASDSVNVTLQFKNTGTATWSNSSNRLLLQTANPSGRTSSLQGAGWVDVSTPAVLNEPSVAPGSTGTFTVALKRSSNPYDVQLEDFSLTVEGVTMLRGYYELLVDLTCTLGQATNPRPNGLVLYDPSNGSVYLLDGGEKRHVDSPMAMATNGLSFDRMVTADAAELASFSDGPPLFIREGSLVKSSSSPAVYLIDETVAGSQRRHVLDMAAMNAFGLRFDQVVYVDDAELGRYEMGTDITSSSAFPDGRLIHDQSTGYVYLTVDGKKRHIMSPAAYVSYGFSWGSLIDASPTVLTSLPTTTDLGMRPGTIIKSSSLPTVYVVDVANSTYTRRPITDPPTFTSAGFVWSDLRTLSDSEVAYYDAGNEVACYR